MGPNMGWDKDDGQISKEKADKAGKVKRYSHKMKLLIVLAALATYATAFVPPSIPIRSATSLAFGMSSPDPEGK